MTQVLRFPQAAPIRTGGSVITIGNFDGLHLGHQKILDRTREIAGSRSLACVALSFEPHPAKVLKKGKCAPLIYPYHERVRLLSDMELDYFVIQEFTAELSRQTAEDWATEVLAKGLDARHIVVGYDFHFGYQAQGDAELLARIGSSRDFSVEEVPAFFSHGRPVSSSRIRRLVLAGEISMAKDIMGYCFHLRGVAEEGQGRGASLGFPTANLKTDWELIPLEGVYACLALSGGQRYLAGVNIGRRPTFGGGKTVIEVHLLDAEDVDRYGEEITIFFVRRLRDEIRFAEADHLKAQLEKDMARVREVLESVTGIELR